MNKNLFLLIILLFFNHFVLKSQTTGNLDLTFGDQGIIESSTEKYYFPYYISIQEKSGEIFTCGQENMTNNTTGTEGIIKRFDFYGNPKNTFGQNGTLKIVFPGAVNQRIFQIIPDDSNLGTQGFFLRGQYVDANNNLISYISKHNADGSLDVSYGNNGILNLYGQIAGSYIYSLDLNPNTGHQFLKRYHLIDGTLDSTFANEELPNLDSQQHYNNGQYNFINIQKNGKIVLVGYNKISETEKNTSIARFNSNGTLDSSFGNGGFVTYFDSYLPQESITQSDGKIVYTDGNGNFKRLNENGTIDTSYGNNGVLNINTGTDHYIYAYNLKIQSDDKIYFNGRVLNDYYNSGDTSSQYISRINTNGTIDFIYKSFQNTYYSEIWSSALINNSFILTNGIYATDPNNWNSVIQRIYTKAPIISLFGSSTNNSDIDLNTTDFKIFTGNINLSAGSVKFRLDHSDSFNWGGLGLLGSSTMGQNDIQITNPGVYEVIFNLHNGDYSFINHLSISEKDKNPFKIFPNPTHDVINFNINVSNIKIYDKSGKLISSISEKVRRVNISNYPPNTYTIIFTTEGGSVYKKEIIKR